MMVRNHIAMLLLAAVLAGCASPAQRIKKNPELFASFPPEVQAAVQEGRIEPGYTDKMVYIALGKPQRIYRRQLAEGERIVWSYTRSYYTQRIVPVSRPYSVRDASGRIRHGYTQETVSVEDRHEYEAARVEFEDGVVVAIEIEQQP